MMKNDTAGPKSCALGPNAVGRLDDAHRHLLLSSPNRSFSSATIYYPQQENSESSHSSPSIVIIGGWGCGEQATAAWAPFLASHGIVAMTIGLRSPWKASPSERSQALLDASQALQSENDRSDSPLHGRLDTSARAVMGYSLGGGGAQLAAQKDPTLRCSIALCPHDGMPDFEKSFHEKLSGTVPVLIVCSERDDMADSQTQAWVHYRKTTTAPKLLFEISGGDHYTVLGPAGGTEAEFEKGAGPFAICNCCLATIFCLWAPFAFGTLDGPTGHAREESPRGAIGGVVLAYLRLFLLGDESARSLLSVRPDIASGFESERIDRPV